MFNNFSYNFIRILCFLLIVLVLYFAVSSVELSSLSTSVSIAGDFDQWEEGLTPDGSVYNNGLGNFVSAFSQMQYNVARILSFTHGLYNNASTTNSYLAQIYTKVYDILDTLVNHASIVSSNFTLVRNSLDGISGYLNNIMSYTASTRDNTLAIADRLMYNNLSAAEYLDSINNHFVAANNSIRILHTDNLNTNRYLTQINDMLLFTYPDNTQHNISDIVYNSQIANYNVLSNIKNNTDSIINKINKANWHNGNFNFEYSTDNVNFTSELTQISYVPDFYIRIKNNQLNDNSLSLINLPVYISSYLSYDDWSISVTRDNFNFDFDYFINSGNIGILFTPSSFYSWSGSSYFVLVHIHSDHGISTNLSFSPSGFYLDYQDKDFYDVYNSLFIKSNNNYLKSIDSHLEDIHFTMTNPLVSYDDNNKVNVDISGSDTLSTGNIITKLRNMFSTGVSSSQFITTLDDTSFYKFFTDQIDSDLNDLSTTYNEPIY